MKRFLFLAFCALLSYTGVQAQQPQYAGRFDSQTGPDTLTNADTYQVTATVKGVKSTVSIQVNVAKISGTVGGTIKYYGSVDGTNYKLIQTDNLTDASAIYGYTWTGNPYQKYRALVTTSGTQSSSYDLWILYR